MAKYFVVGVLLVTLAVAVQGFPADLDDVSTAAAAGDWKKVSEILDAYYKSRYGLQQQYQGFPTSPQGFLAGPQGFPAVPRGFGSADVRSLKPEAGGRVYAAADYNYRAATNDNGKVREVSGGHRIVNDNGKVSEMDYTPRY